MNRLSFRRALHRITAQVAIVLVLILAGLALNGFAHAHDDHGWHPHPGLLSPESPLEGPSQAPGDGHEGHDVQQRAVDLVVRAPQGRALPKRDIATPPVTAVAVIPLVLVRPRAARPRTGFDAADPPPVIRATSGTVRVLRTSHSLRF